jgi:hypothetical protein
LEVQFLIHPTKAEPGVGGPGDIYDYSGVSQMIYDGLMSAPSKGHYLYQVIKRGNYAYTKVFDVGTQQGSVGGSTGLSESLVSPTAVVAAATSIIAPPTATPVTPTDPSLTLPSLGDLL